MNALLTPFRQLVDRKLWPVALLLVAALAAVPVLLAKDDAPVAAPVATGSTAVAAADQSQTQPIVTLGDATARESSRKVLGSRKDPFEAKVKAKKADSTATTATAKTATTDPTPSTGGGTLSTGTTIPDVQVPSGTAPTEPTVKRKTYDIYTTKIRFGRSSDEGLDTGLLRRLEALPDVDDPKVVYLGIKRDLKTAVFLLAADTRVLGEGRCLPDPVNCQTVELKAGETQFIDVLDGSGQSRAQYQLDMVRVQHGEVYDPKVARRWRHTIAKGGRDALRANLSRVNHWKFDVSTGTVYRAIED